LTALRSLFVKNHPFGKIIIIKKGKKPVRLYRGQLDKSFPGTPLLGVRLL
jgi:hypothetical protein